MLFIRYQYCFYASAKFAQIRNPLIIICVYIFHQFKKVLQYSIHRHILFLKGLRFFFIFFLSITLSLLESAAISKLLIL